MTPRSRLSAVIAAAGRMLFLGLGTGLGSALVWKDHVLPLELGDLPYGDGIIEDWLGDEGMSHLGKKEWQRETVQAIQQLKLAVIADYVVLGGGNAKIAREIARRRRTRSQPQRLSRWRPALGNRSGNETAALAHYLGLVRPALLMRQYQDLLRLVLEKGRPRTDRTGTGTLSVFGAQARFDLRESFPAC